MLFAVAQLALCQLRISRHRAFSNAKFKHQVRNIGSNAASILHGRAIAIIRFAAIAFYHGEYYTYTLTRSIMSFHFDALVVCITSL
jgi:hypothetical protein